MPHPRDRRSGCGACLAACPQQALAIKEGKAVPDPHRCVLCGYCAPACPTFSLRII